MKRTKQTEAIIASVNTYLKNNHVTDISNDVFVVVTDALISSKAYKGFNLYTASGNLSGGVNTDYIQIY